VLLLLVVVHTTDAVGHGQMDLLLLHALETATSICSSARQ
jgi:hypothetical protein